MNKLLLVTCVLFTLTTNAQSWQEDVEQWRSTRISNLTKEHGWLSLIGMQWLQAGDNSIGAAPDNDIVLPHGAAYVGVFNLQASKIKFTAHKDVNIQVNNKPLQGVIEVAMDSSSEPTIFTIDTFNFHVIERGKPALRIKDSQADTRVNFKGIEYFPLTEKFNLQAKFVPYNPVKEIEIINVLGILSKEQAIGKLTFKIDDKNYQLDVMDAEDNFYIMFADKTNGRTSYGPGRFLLVPKPKQGSNMTTINFHQAYNPPCAFTDYSTCPLPPPQNRLQVYIEAGEKKYTYNE
ncbi:MAG: DUF1684 domain-containing protein [Proteobacteria bacterium]|nr:DUF1684 domain-containing protein [Pseudomonadota bacterium]